MGHLCFMLICNDTKNIQQNQSQILFLITQASYFIAVLLNYTVVHNCTLYSSVVWMLKKMINTKAPVRMTDTIYLG